MKWLRSQVSRSEKIAPVSMVQASLQLPRGYLNLLAQYGGSLSILVCEIQQTLRHH